MNTLSALALAVVTMCAPVSVPVEPASVAPTCANMGTNFQCDEERALSATSVDIWEENFNLTYITTRTDGIKPVVNPDMVVIRDDEFPNMYHVFNMRYAPMLHV